MNLTTPGETLSKNVLACSAARSSERGAEIISRHALNPRDFFPPDFKALIGHRFFNFGDGREHLFRLQSAQRINQHELPRRGGFGLHPVEEFVISAQNLPHRLHPFLSDKLSDINFVAVKALVGVGTEYFNRGIQRFHAVPRKILGSQQFLRGLAESGFFLAFFLTK